MTTAGETSGRGERGGGSRGGGTRGETSGPGARAGGGPASGSGGGRGRPAPRSAVEVLGPLTGQGAAVEAVLRALPAWFGIESALVDYARAADELPTFAIESGGVTVGFLTVRPTSAAALELHVMGVRPERHRRGLGRALVEHAAAYARAHGYLLLHVKTLAPSDPDPGYAATRRFYEAVGFVPLEELPQVWGPENPCLLMVKML